MWGSLAFGRRIGEQEGGRIAGHAGGTDSGFLWISTHLDGVSMGDLAGLGMHFGLDFAGQKQGLVTFPLHFEHFPMKSVRRPLDDFDVVLQFHGRLSLADCRRLAGGDGILLGRPQFPSAG